MSESYRIERDSMGEMRVPADALYGPQTQRAVENFPISGLRLPRAFIRALGLIKACAANVNGRPGVEQAAIEVAEGKLFDPNGAKGRFVRLSSKGNTTNDLNHYVEVEVYGLPK